MLAYFNFLSVVLSVKITTISVSIFFRLHTFSHSKSVTTLPCKTQNTKICEILLQVTQLLQTIAVLQAMPDISQALRQFINVINLVDLLLHFFPYLPSSRLRSVLLGGLDNKDNRFFIGLWYKNVDRSFFV